MALSINSNNTFSFGINKAQQDNQTALQRLSSGKKVNSAADNAAALFIIQQQTADIRGIDQSVRNASDGISLAQTAQGALGQINNNVQRIRELTLQASSDTVGDTTGIQFEIDQLTQENSRISQTTTFNGRNLFDGSSINFQVGENAGAGSQIGATLGSLNGLNSIDATDLRATGTIDVSTPAAARASLALLDNDINAVSQQSGTFGALQNRFVAATNSLQDRSENLLAARSRIEDADFAQESARLASAQVLQQAGISVAAQANLSKQATLSLLN